MPKPLITATLAALASMAVLDFLWLSTVTKLLYRPKLGALLNEQLVWPPAILFYLLYGFGLALFVLRPALGSGASPLTAALYGAAFGLVAYGAYDLTNHATLRGWPLSITIVDMAWGAFVTAVATGIGVWAGQKWG
ncbi:DUF2177 family protein [Ferrovibrio sp.]|uniref:DUF2177 family protein n=1 Tax=Ferrovibrio sp. TaxID=1917215 RepID=UPI000CB451D4|nr:DUF2177 family protein [Ferrovibrio sp.]PJI37615.1 MAG: hypothetical protein CTR53_19210 [Ferrovibrio sp.]